MDKVLRIKKSGKFLGKIWNFVSHHNAIVIALELAIFAGVILTFAAPDDNVNLQNNVNYETENIKTANLVVPEQNNEQPQEGDGSQGQSSQPSTPASQTEKYKFSDIQKDLDGVQFADLRKIVDPPFNLLHDQLSDAYYNYWKEGLSKSFYGYDAKPTLVESKEQFDKLHGLIFMLRDVKFNEENLKQPPSERTPEEEYNTEEIGGVSFKKSDLLLEKINKLKTEGIELKL